VEDQPARAVGHVYRSSRIAATIWCSLHVVVRAWNGQGDGRRDSHRVGALAAPRLSGAIQVVGLAYVAAAVLSNSNATNA
jgi:hypothetical protein